MISLPREIYDADCRRCPRLHAYLKTVRAQFPNYHARPVAPFGADLPRLLLVGLAPGMHGANATGRPFTGDHAGILLYKALHHFGWSTQPDGARPDDGLQLLDCRITNAVKCVPPENKPTPSEIRTCNSYLARELTVLDSSVRVVLALGRIAHDAVLRAYEYKTSAFKFAHGAEHVLTGSLVLIDSYHCSRYNTQTGRLTEAMFFDVFRAVERHLGRRPRKTQVK